MCSPLRPCLWACRLPWLRGLSSRTMRVSRDRLLLTEWMKTFKSEMEPDVLTLQMTHHQTAMLHRYL